jgi:hypothetical protein
LDAAWAVTKEGGRSMKERVYEVVCSECDVVAKVLEPMQKK